MPDVLRDERPTTSCPCPTEHSLGAQKKLWEGMVVGGRAGGDLGAKGNPHLALKLPELEFLPCGTWTLLIQEAHPFLLGPNPFHHNQLPPTPMKTGTRLASSSRKPFWTPHPLYFHHSKVEIGFCVLIVCAPLYLLNIGTMPGSYHCVGQCLLLISLLQNCMRLTLDILFLLFPDFCSSDTWLYFSVS